jgi:hypothetical protein
LPLLPTAAEQRVTPREACRGITRLAMCAGHAALERRESTILSAGELGARLPV